MGARTYEVAISGDGPLLMHSDNIDWADEMSAWKDDPENKSKSRAGDDRTPAWRWLGCCYSETNNPHLVIPSDNISRCLMEGGTMVPVPGGKSGKTFKMQTQSGMIAGETSWPLTVDGKPISVAPIQGMHGNPNFHEHRALAEDLGFDLYVKRVRIGQTKHIRVRPRFRNWGCKGTVIVWDDQITTPILESIVFSAGKYKGLCDWRPSSKTPGSHGMFTATVAEV